MSRRNIELELEGLGALQLRLDFNALATFEKETGRNALSEGLWLDLSATDLRALVWACALHARPLLELSDVGEALDLDALEKVQEVLNRLWGLALPDPEPAGEDKGEAPDPPRD